ncbi:MAG: hypothetical protein AAF970_09735, partial [Bacteroidota bacterium]
MLLGSALQPVQAQPGPRPSGAVAAEALAADQPGEELILEMLNVKDADLRDVFRGIAHQYNLNLMVDNRIDRRVTIRLANVPVLDAVTFLCRQNGLRLQQEGAIYRIELPPEPRPAPPRPPDIIVQDSLLTLNLQGEPVEQVITLLAERSGHNLVLQPGVRGALRGRLQRVPFEVGLRTIMETNGFTVREKEDIYYIDQANLAGEDGQPRGQLWVQVDDEERITLDVTQAPITAVLREVASQLDVNLVTYDTPDRPISAKVSGLTFDETLNFLFKGTDITYRQEGALYIVGSKETSGIATTRLLRLSHIRADAVLEMLPEAILSNATIEVVREHNGIMVTGPSDVIVELEHFIDEVDYPTPQILIEALVVDFEANDLFDLGLSFGRDAAQAAEASTQGFHFGGGDDQAGGFQAGADGRQTNEVLNKLNPLTSVFGLRNIGRLPDDFYFRINALSTDGKVDIRSRPQISTLNGHTASISIGTTQYYILETATPFQSPNQVVVQQSQRFETVEANVQLEVTPWVSSSGEVTADIRPEFSTPVGDLVPGVPPTINSRILESTVRLQDGETIVLGGLINESEEVVRNKVPVLGSIPLLGRLFRSKKRDTRKSELLIFLTPHVFYGDERDAERWDRLKDRAGFTPSGER